MRTTVAGLILIAMSAGLAIAGPMDEVPPAFQVFESMVGGWKGNASPSTNRARGWTETHGWAWKFDQGKPVGMTLSLEGNKLITKGQLRYDLTAKKYHLDGTNPAGKPVAFVGSLSPDGKSLTLDRVGPAAEGKDRLIIRLNSNKIRYTLLIDHQEPGAPQFKTIISVGLTKDGESFAAGGSDANLPKCIMTGGASTLTVSYQGKTYPVCCSGCRDEFNDNPEKYARKAEAATKTKPGEKPPATKGKDDGSFDGLIDDSKPRPNPK